MPRHELSRYPLPSSPQSTLSAARTRRAITAKYSTTKLSPTEWEVVEATPLAGNNATVLGFIQLCSGRYEVTRLGGPRIEFSTCQSLTDAVTALSARPLRMLTLVAPPPWS